ncbi:MAG: trypsin-like peptidase domain-containing protein [Pseudomonadota bacterium]|nr:trypsin-like peptidase domain-containing protein [Pseudomonadota bacterium]
MKKAPLYSRSRSPGPAAQGAAVPDPGLSTAEHPSAPPRTAALSPSPATTRRARMGRVLRRHERRLWAAAVLLVLATAVALHAPPRRPVLTMAQIDSAMRKSIADKPLPSPVASAYDAIIPSVVRVVGLMTEGDDGSDTEEDASAAPEHPAPGASNLPPSSSHHGTFERGIGTGVVVVDNGTILTNLHVIHGARRVKVTFMDGTNSDAVVVSTQPENDLAVLRAKVIPDDLEAATLRSTSDLAPGDQVMAVGFPFGIGPSASAGVVSGLKREFRSPEGKQTLTNLIQFDAAANPGNSGGPLVTMDGEVVGIVTAILNPSHQRTFIGIGFAIPIENAAAAVGMPPF